MVIQLQKYNGRNIYNNKIDIDFEKKKVGFVPIKDKSELSYYRIFFLNLFFVFLIISAVINIGMFIILESLGIVLNSFLAAIHIIIVAVSLAFPTSLLFWNKEFKHNHYPIFNKRLLLLLGSKKKEKEVEPHSIIDNKFIIPYFDNTVLQYELFGDFAEQIKRIQVKNIFKKDPYRWYALFEFKKTPINGRMNLLYV